MDVQIDAGGWVWFVAGPTASGKSTVAESLARSLNFTYIEGDDAQYHPPSNVSKMSKGIGLTDEDRQAWLSNLQNVCTQKYAEGTRYMAVSASALKRQYRDRLREVSQHSDGVRVGFIFLDVPEDVTRDRATKRHGHYAGSNLVHSQFEALEEPTDDEAGVVRVDGNRPIEVVSQDVVRKVADSTGIEPTE